MKRVVAVFALVLCVAGTAAASTASTRAVGLTTWSAAGSRVAFVASSSNAHRGYLWTQPFGDASPRLLRASPPVGEEEIDALAPGPAGSWAALERTIGNTESSYTLDVVSSRGGGAAVTRSSRPILLVGDGTFLGYLAATAHGYDLFRVSGAHATRVAALAGVTSPQEVAAANGHFAVREADGTVEVFTDRGARLASIAAAAASLSTTADRVVVRSRAGRLKVYGLRGGPVHDWKLAASAWTSGLAAFGAYAVYLGANKAVHAVRLANGADRVVARAGSGFFSSGVALQRAGALVPLTAGRATTLRFIPSASL